jgi:hypothetical protein
MKIFAGYLLLCFLAPILGQFSIETIRFDPSDESNKLVKFQGWYFTELQNAGLKTPKLMLLPRPGQKVTILSQLFSL